MEISATFSASEHTAAAKTTGECTLAPCCRPPAPPQADESGHSWLQQRCEPPPWKLGGTPSKEKPPVKPVYSNTASLQG